MVQGFSFLSLILFILAYMGAFYKGQPYKYTAFIRFISISYIFYCGFSAIISLFFSLFIFSFGIIEDELIFRFLLSIFNIIIVQYVLKEIFGKNSLKEIFKYLIFRLKVILNRFKNKYFNK